MSPDQFILEIPQKIYSVYNLDETASLIMMLEETPEIIQIHNYHRQGKRSGVLGVIDSSK